MTLTFKGLSKNSKTAFYTGAATVLRFSVSSFVNKTPPSTIEIEGDFAEAKTAKAAMTTEERKAARAAKPKPTLAERVAAAQERATKLAKKLADVQAGGGASASL